MSRAFETLPMLLLLFGDGGGAAATAYEASVSLCHATHCHMPTLISFLLYHCTFKLLIVCNCAGDSEQLWAQISHAFANAISVICHLIGWCQPLNWYSSRCKRPAVSMVLFDLITKVNWRAECRSDHVRNSFGNRQTAKITVNKLRKLFFIVNMCEQAKDHDEIMWSFQLNLFDLFLIRFFRLVFYFVRLQAAGIAAFTLFGWALTDTSLLVSLTQGKNEVYIGLLIFVGVATLVIIIAFLGCCGALKESQCMLVSVRWIFLKKKSYSLFELNLLKTVFVGSFWSWLNINGIPISNCAFVVLLLLINCPGSRNSDRRLCLSQSRSAI